MRNEGKKNVIGILVDAVDYETAVEFILREAKEKRGATVSALAVHGLMTGVVSAAQRFRLNHFDLLVPDGQPVRWALNLLHGVKLHDRVYGPTLTLKVCERAATEGLAIFLYGGTHEILSALTKSLKERFSAILIAGTETSRFRRLSPREKRELVSRIKSSGASIALVGLGCPRQEVFAYEFHKQISMPTLAVGAAFPFIAGLLPQAPSWMQDRGLEWFFRLCFEPGRLWRRYLYLNPAYLCLLALQASGIKRFSTKGMCPTHEELYG